MEILNQVRGYSYLLGVLKTQQADPFCPSCSAFSKTLTALRESLDKFESEHYVEIQGLSGEFSRLFAEAKSGIAAVRHPDNPTGQKKAGNCKLPQGVCFTKLSLAILQKVQPDSPA
ncbi:MAG TPA: hypothetical protein VFK23_12010 [Nitrospirota bacterium]|jgi:hypothetical protein|nr:hypothetical protein [Nitrospirota bacterium]